MESLAIGRNRDVWKDRGWNKRKCPRHSLCAMAKTIPCSSLTCKRYGKIYSGVSQMGLFCSSTCQDHPLAPRLVQHSQLFAFLSPSLSLLSKCLAQQQTLLGQRNLVPISTMGIVQLTNTHMYFLLISKQNLQQTPWQN